MQNQNKVVLSIDERAKGRKGIEEMLKHMDEIDDLDEKSELVTGKETA